MQNVIYDRMLDMWNEYSVDWQYSSANFIARRLSRYFYVC